MTILNRLRSAESGSRELDLEVLREVSPNDLATAYMPLPVSTSIDAALALVDRMLPGHRFALYTNGGGNGPCCLVLIGDEPVVANVHAQLLPSPS